MKTIEALSSSKTRARQSEMRRKDSVRTRYPGHLLHQREEFLALFTHELLTPLTCILGWSQFAAEQSDPATVKNALAIIERNVRRQKALLDEFLALIHYTRSCSLAFNPRKFELWHLVEPPDALPHTAPRERQLSLPF